MNTQLLKAFYAISDTKFNSRCPGIFFDGNAKAVISTDANIMSISCVDDIPDQYFDKIVEKSGNILDYHYPKYRSVLPEKFIDKTEKYDIKDFECNIKKAYRHNKKSIVFVCENWYKAEYLLKMVDVFKSVGVKTITLRQGITNNLSPLVVEEGDTYVMICRCITDESITVNDNNENLYEYSYLDSHEFEPKNKKDVVWF